MADVRTAAHPAAPHLLTYNFNHIFGTFTLNVFATPSSVGHAESLCPGFAAVREVRAHQAGAEPAHRGAGALGTEGGAHRGIAAGAKRTVLAIASVSSLLIVVVRSACRCLMQSQDAMIHSKRCSAYYRHLLAADI